jgi:hypothetical protein
MNTNTLSLPKIVAPKYYLTVPSTGETIEYRPFLVKEEKILMIAQEANTQSAMTSALKDIIRSCTYDTVDLYSLTMYDLEYIFLNLRAKSVGETTEISIKCGECDEYVTTQIDLTTIEVKNLDSKVDNKIQLTDTVGVTLKAPGLKEMERATRTKSNSVISESIAAVLDTIYDSDTVYPIADTNQKELEAFIDSLSHAQLEKIQDWILQIPRLEHTLKITCSKGHTTERTLSGLSDFFV